MLRTLVTAMVLLLTLRTSSFAQSPCPQECIPEWTEVRRTGLAQLHPLVTCDGCRGLPGRRLFAAVVDRSGEDPIGRVWNVFER